MWGSEVGMGWELGARQQDFTQLSLSGLVASWARSLGGRHRQAAAAGGPARRPRPARWASAGGVRGGGTGSGSESAKSGGGGLGKIEPGRGRRPPCGKGTLGAQGTVGGGG